MFKRARKLCVGSAARARARAAAAAAAPVTFNKANMFLAAAAPGPAR